MVKIHDLEIKIEVDDVQEACDGTFLPPCLLERKGDCMDSTVSSTKSSVKMRAKASATKKDHNVRKISTKSKRVQNAKRIRHMKYVWVDGKRLKFHQLLSAKTYTSKNSRAQIEYKFNELKKAASIYRMHIQDMFAKVESCQEKHSTCLKPTDFFCEAYKCSYCHKNFPDMATINNHVNKGECEAEN